MKKHKIISRKQSSIHISIQKKKKRGKERCGSTRGNIKKIHKVLVLPHLEDCVQCSPPYLKKDMAETAEEQLATRLEIRT